METEVCPGEKLGRPGGDLWEAWKILGRLIESLGRPEKAFGRLGIDPGETYGEPSEILGDTRYIWVDWSLS